MALLVLGPSLPVAQLAAGFTGHLLPWDQLALVAVTVGRNTKGYADAFGPGTKYVLVDGAEISKATLWRWFILHTAVISGVTVVLTAIALRLGPRSRSSP